MARKTRSQQTLLSPLRRTTQRLRRTTETIRRNTDPRRSEYDGLLMQMTTPMMISTRYTCTSRNRANSNCCSKTPQSTRYSNHTLVIQFSCVPVVALPCLETEVTETRFGRKSRNPFAANKNRQNDRNYYHTPSTRIGKMEVKLRRT